MWLSGAFQMINVANTVDDETKHPQRLASTFRALISPLVSVVLVILCQMTVTLYKDSSSIWMLVL